jgi:hypothetical protein
MSECSGSIGEGVTSNLTSILISFHMILSFFGLKLLAVPRYRDVSLQSGQYKTLNNQSEGGDEKAKTLVTTTAACPSGSEFFIAFQEMLQAT